MCDRQLASAFVCVRVGPCYSVCLVTNVVCIYAHCISSFAIELLGNI